MEGHCQPEDQTQAIVRTEVNARKFFFFLNKDTSRKDKYEFNFGIR